MRVFISYASEDRNSAEQIHLALVGAGIHTFFDQEGLPAGGDFNSRIRAAVEASDLFVFLVSPESIAKGSYALSELQYARLKWPHPKGRVLPVMTRHVDSQQVPPYLLSVTILEPEGNLVADVLLAISEMADSLKPHRFVAALVGVAIVLAIVAWVVYGGLQNRSLKAESDQTRPRALAPFVGVWESDEMDEPPVTVGDCLQDAKKKFYLQIYEATPGSYVARLRSEITGELHSPNSSYALPGPPCSSSVPAFHGSHDFPSSIAAVADYVLSFEIHASQDQFVAKFKLNSNELLPLPGGFDILLNNTNRATFANSSAPLGFYRR